MNKGRPKMFSQKMKGVFRSRSRLSATQRNPDMPESDSKPETHKEIFSDLKTNKTICPNFKSPDCGVSYGGHTIPRESKVCFRESGCDPRFKVGTRAGSPRTGFEHSKCGSQPSIHTITSEANTDAKRGMSTLTNTHPKRFVKDKGSFKINEVASGTEENGGFTDPSKESESTRKNIINGSCQFCPLDLDINQTSRDKIYDREIPPRNTRSKEFDLANNSGSFWSSNQSFNVGLDMCYNCLKYNCICGNNNVISTNNNYLIKTFPTQQRNTCLFSPVLQYAFGEERTNRNDFIILALGIHHYIKEVFNALDSNNNGYVHYGDLQLLCTILGKNLQDLDKQYLNSSCANGKLKGTKLCADSSCYVHLHFGKFSELICNTFSDLTESNYFGKRKNTQLVNAMVNVTRRNKSLITLSEQLETLEKEYNAMKNNAQYIQAISGMEADNSDSQTREINKGNKTNDSQSNNVYLENLKLQKIILLQQQELQCLREVIEDLRVSLQCSDAENLSLKVQEAKMQDCSSISSSEDISSPNLSSSDDERDSIDSIIENFPSSEHLLLNSKESLLSFESLNLSTLDLAAPVLPRPLQASTTEGAVKPSKGRSTLPRNETDEDLSLENEIQLAYQNLSETQSELEETRNDLETTVSQIQDKESRLRQLDLRLNETKAKYEKSLKENAVLKENFECVKNENDTMVCNIRQLQHDLQEMQDELSKKDKEIIYFSDRMKEISFKRREDIQKLATARDIIATSIREAKRNEDIIKSFLKTCDKTPAVGDISKHDQSCVSPGSVSRERLVQRDNNNNNETLNSGKETDNQNVGEYCQGNKIHGTIECSSNKDAFSGDSLGSSIVVNNNEAVKSSFETQSAEERNRLNLSPCELRRNEFDCKKNSWIRESRRDENPSAISNQFSPSLREDTEVSSSSTVNNNSNVSKSEGRERTSAGFSDVKQTKTTSSKEKHSLMTSPILEDKPTMEVKPNLIKPIPVLKPLFRPLKYPVEQVKSSSEPEFLLNDAVNELETTTQSYFERKSGHWESDVISPLKTPYPETYSHQDLEFPSKCFPLPRTSTEILEGLEAEVEFLRKSLDED